MQSKELKSLMNFVKKIKGKQVLKKVKSIDDEQEKIDVIKYFLKSKLEIKNEHIKKEIEKMKEKNKDVFFAETKLSLLRSKTKFFVATYHKKDFENVLRLLKEVESEIKNV